MKRLLIVFVWAGLAFATVRAQDPVKVTGKQCKVDFENDYVRVLHWTIGPHEKTPKHSHPALVTVVLTATKTRYTLADGKTRDVESKPGQAAWSDPEEHASENLGDDAGEVIQVELKKKPDSTMTSIPASADVIKLDPKHYQVEFQNDRVRVLRVKYGPGEKSVMHGHPANVAVFLTDGRTKMTLPDGKTSQRDLKAGQVLWTGKEDHLPEHVGGQPFELVLVELR